MNAEEVEVERRERDKGRNARVAQDVFVAFKCLFEVLPYLTWRNRTETDARRSVGLSLNDLAFLLADFPRIPDGRTRERVQPADRLDRQRQIA